MNYRLIRVFFLLNFSLSFIVFSQAYPVKPSFTKLSLGRWHAEILRSDGHTIPFQFETQQFNSQIIIFVINGKERLKVDNIREPGDSLFIDMPFFDAHFALRIVDQRTLEGNYIKNYGARKVLIPFRAVFNRQRYMPGAPPTHNISGRWSVHFRGANDSTESVGEFTQNGDQVRGTFLTSTGDYRYLEGIVSGNTLQLSTFDGGHAYAFAAEIFDSSRIVNGKFYSGATSVESWVAERNDRAVLPDEYSLVSLSDPANARLHFSFPDLQGKMISLSDSIYNNKVVIVQILGSWCPNCMDETGFLAPWFTQNKSRGIEIIGLAYERTTSVTDAKRPLQPFISRFGITYPILPTGVMVSDSLRTQKTLPEIRAIVGFPTTIFIDKKGLIRKIATGFNGPGTGVHYELYKKEFNALVDGLVAE